MKSLILLMFFVTGFSGNELKIEEDDFSWLVKEMETEVLPELGFAEHQIRIYDFDGNLMGVYSQDKFIENDLALPELRVIMESEFLFEYQGDNYYLKG